MFRVWGGEVLLSSEALPANLVGCLAVEDALAASVVSGVEAAEQLLKLGVRLDGDVEHLITYAAVEPLTIPFVWGE